MSKKTPGPGQPPPATTPRENRASPPARKAPVSPRAKDACPAPTPSDDADISTAPVLETPADIAAVMRDETLYDCRPQEMYKLAERMGIDITLNKHTSLKKAAACLGTVFRVIGNDLTDKCMLWSMTKSIAGDLEDLIGAADNVVTELPRPKFAPDRLIWHSIYTSILTMALARDTPDLPCSIQEIGAAALLHDTGKLVLPEFFNSVNQENSPVYQEHVIRSVELAREIEAPDIVITAIAQHHEQLDGKGFPNHITGAEMLLTSQMVAIANIFEQAQISHLVPTGEVASPIPVDIPMLFKKCHGAFDDALLEKMIGMIGFYPAGSIVELSDRSVCKVIRQNTDYPLHPVVQVIMDGEGNHPAQAQVIDLRQAAMLSITKSISRAAGQPPATQ